LSRHKNIDQNQSKVTDSLWRHRHIYDHPQLAFTVEIHCACCVCSCQSTQLIIKHNWL